MSKDTDVSLFCDLISCEVTGLSVGSDYLFRVSAVNSIGASQYSPVSNIVRATPHAEDVAALAPSISDLPESVRVSLNVSAGAAHAAVTIRCVVHGAAPLRLRAFRGDSTELLTGSKYALSLNLDSQSESNVSSALLSINAVSARDLGDYRLQVSNAFGAASGSCRLVARGTISSFLLVLCSSTYCIQY